MVNLKAATLFLLIVLIIIPFSAASQLIKTKTYDFSSTYESINMWYYEDDVSSCTNPPSNGVFPSCSSLTDISSSSSLNSKDDSGITTSGSGSLTLLKTLINEYNNPDKNITFFNATYTLDIGSGVTTSFYWWNTTKSNWTLARTAVEGTNYVDYNVTSNYYSSIINSSGYVHILLADDSSGGWSTDYIQFLVTYTDFIDVNLTSESYYFSNQSIPIQINTSDPYNNTIFIEYANTNRRLNKTLCTDCHNWSGILTFPASEQNIVFYVNDSNGNLFSEDYNIIFNSVIDANTSHYDIINITWCDDSGTDESHSLTGITPVCDGTTRDITTNFSLDFLDGNYSDLKAKSTSQSFVKVWTNLSSYINTNFILKFINISTSFGCGQYCGNFERGYIWNTSLMEWSTMWSNSYIITNYNIYNMSFSFTNSTKASYVNASNNFMYYLIYLDLNANGAVLRSDYTKVSVVYNIGNPNLTIPSISPLGTLYSNNSLNCSTTPNDNYNTSIITLFKWYNNSIQMPAFDSNTTCTAGTTCYASKLYNSLNHFDNITCEVQSFDGTYYSDSENSTISYVNNSLPTIASAQINNSAPADDDDLACINGSLSDIDYFQGKDVLTLYYDWNKNGAWQGINSYNLSSGHTTTNDIWYCEILVSDGYSNSSWVSTSSVSVGTSLRPPLVNYTNATSSNTGIASNDFNPTNNNSWVNLSAYVNDTNTGELWTTYFCSGNGFSISGCTENTYCITEVNSSSKQQSCRYNLSGIGEQIVTYYAFILDNSSLFSSGLQGSFQVNHPPTRPTLNTSNATFSPQTWVLLDFFSSDDDTDSINYTVYSNASGSFTSVYSNTSSRFNYTGLSEKTYSYFVEVKDQHSYYNQHNSSTQIFTVDLTYPKMNVTSPSQGTTYNSETTSLTISASDTYLSTCYYKIYYKDTQILMSTSTATCAGSTTITTPYYSGSYMLRIYANDSAGNINSTEINFTTEASAGTVVPAGGSTEVITVIQEPPKKNCNIVLNPKEVIFDTTNILAKVDITNNENESYSPVYKIDDTNLISIPGFTIQVVQPGKTIELVVQYNRQLNITKDIATNIIIKSSNCNDILLPINIKSGISWFFGDSSIASMLKAEIIDEMGSLKLGKYTIKIRFIYVIVLIAALVGILIYFVGRGTKNIVGKIFLWALLTFFLSLLVKYSITFAIGGIK